MNRRQFIGATALTGAGMVATPVDVLGGIHHLTPITSGANNKAASGSIVSVKGDIISPMQDENFYLHIWEVYTEGSGLRMGQYEYLYSSSDFEDGFRVRYSDDNGRTWGPWKDLYDKFYERIGDQRQHERLRYNFIADTYNPVHRHFVSAGFEIIYAHGHIDGFSNYWNKGAPSSSVHTYLCVRQEGSDVSTPTLVRYEEGSEYDPANPIDENFFLKNHAFGYGFWVMKNGDVIFPFGVPVSTCCRILGIDVQDIFPSRPDTFYGLIVGRGKWNGEKYDFTFSRPIVISDLKSSRGAFEPAIAELDSGRILVTFRGSNVQSKNWNTRIVPGTPGHTWHCYSDDGGKTFTDPAPWHFDNGEVIYSPAVPSRFIRSSKNGKLYWIGNITDHRVNGNYPRYPIQIVEVDDQYGTAKRDTLTMIDTRREGESEFIQLTNMEVMDDRETGDLACFLTKIGTLGTESDRNWRGAVWKYRIKLA